MASGWWVWGANGLSRFQQHNAQSQHVTNLSDTLNMIFTVLFTVEMILKLMAFKIKVEKNKRSNGCDGFC